MQHNQIENKEPKVCKAKRYDNSPCGRDLFDYKHCIFHSDNIEGKKAKFENEFWKEFEKQNNEEIEFCDFSRFVFPDSISFEKKEFKKSTYFIEAQFFGEITNFDKTKFLGEFTYFGGTRFEAHVTSFFKAEFLVHEINFGICEFSVASPPYSSEEILLPGCEFLSKRNVDFGSHSFLPDYRINHAEFEAAKFSGENVNFRGAQFLGHTNFSDVEFSGETVDFRESQFLSFAGFRDASFSVKKIDFYNSNFRNVEGLFESISYRKKFFKRKYKIKDFRFNLEEESAINYPLIKRMTQDAWYLAGFKRQHPYVYTAWKTSSDCGRSIIRWAMLSLIIALFFGAVYADYSCPSWLGWMNYNNWLEKINPIMVIEQPNISQKTPQAFIPRIKTSFTPYYFSIVTFTTLGFGDIIPINIWIGVPVFFYRTPIYKYVPRFFLCLNQLATSAAGAISRTLVTKGFLGVTR